MAYYKIYPIRVGVFENLEVSTLTLLQNQGVKMAAPLIMYLIKGEEHCVLVDTGGSDETWAAEHHTRIIRPDAEDPIQALKRFGLAPEDIRYVVNTHLHWDHCFNNDRFPNARIYVQEKELEYAENPLPAHYKFYEAPALGFTPKWMLARDQIVPVTGEYNLLPGIRLVPLPGHTPGFQGVLVDTTQGTYMIASDTIGLISNYIGKAPQQRIASGIYCSLADSYNSLETIYQMADFILPGHDPVVFDHAVYPYNQV